MEIRPSSKPMYVMINVSLADVVNSYSPFSFEMVPIDSVARLRMAAPGKASPVSADTTFPRTDSDCAAQEIVVATIMSAVRRSCIILIRRPIFERLVKGYTLPRRRMVLLSGFFHTNSPLSPADCFSRTPVPGRHEHPG